MTNNENQSKEYAIPMEVTNETIRDYGIDPSKVVWTKIGNRKVRAFMVPCTEEQYYEYMRPLWREDKNAQNREAMESLEKMAEDLDFDPAGSLSTEDGVIANMVLESLIDHLNNIGSEYGDIFRLIYNGGKTVIVKELFARFLRDENYLEMIEWLYTSKIHRPSDYRKYGHVYQQEGEELHNWHKATLNQILNNCAYIGYLICEQVDGERVSGRTSTKVLTGELKVREGNHEPIISEEIFHEVARRFEKRSHKFSSGSSRNLPIEDDIFKDLLFCGLCGGKFTRECGLTNRSGGKVRNYHYRCINKDTIDDRKCNSQRISLIVLNRLVEEALVWEFSLSSLKQKDLVAASKRQAESEKKKMEKEIADADYKIEQLKKSGSEDYIKFRLGELEEAVMKEKAEKRKQDIEKLQERQKILSRRLSEMDGRTEKRNHYLRTLMKCKKETPLTAEVLHVLIDKIEVFPDKKVLIHFAFSGKEIDSLGGGAKL